MLSLEKEFNFFLHNQEKLAKKHKGKYIVIKGNKILGAYNGLSEAVEETAKNEELGTFLVQKCGATKKVYTQHYHSRVNFELK